MEIKYMEVSAKNGEGVEEMFSEMAAQVLHRWKGNPRNLMLTTIVNDREDGSVEFRLDEPVRVDRKKCC